MNKIEQPGSSGRASASMVLLSKVKKHLAVLKKTWWILILTSAAGAGVAYWNTSQKPPSYRSVARMMVSGKIAIPDGAVYSEELANFYGTQSELMQCTEVKRRAAQQVEAQNPELTMVPVGLDVSLQRGTSFFVLGATGSEPNYTQKMLDAVMDEYMQYKRELRIETSDSALTSVTQELRDLDRDLQDGQQALIAFQKKHNVVFLEEEGNSAGKYLLALRQRLAQLKSELHLLDALTLDQNLERHSEVSSEEGSRPPVDASLGLFGAAADYLKAKQQIKLLQAKRERFSKFMREKHPKIVALNAEIAQQESLIELYRAQSVEQLASRRESMQVEIKSIEAQTKELEVKALELNDKIAEYNRLKSRIERAKSLSERLQGTMQSVGVNKSLGQDVLTVMERASSPAAIRPDLAKNTTTGGVAGLLLGLGIIAAIVFLDDRTSSSVELLQSFSEPVIAQIPREKESDERLSLLSVGDEQHMFVEAYRTFRSSLHFMAFEDVRPKVLLVTSAVPGEGKSTVATNLAITLARGGAKTLLIDADLRKGVSHQYFSVPSEPGLSEILRGDPAWRRSVVATSEENLFVIPRGKAIFNAGEHFLSGATDEFLRALYPHCDYIVIDTAPVLASDDTPCLAPKADATLFVVRAGVSSTRLIRSALEILYKRQTNVLGFVLNSAEASTSHAYYYKYSRYYEPESATA